jgi:hypothetical protein
MLNYFIAGWLLLAGSRFRLAQPELQGSRQHFHPYPLHGQDDRMTG